MASDAIIQWKIDGKTMKIMTDCFLGLHNHADGDFSHEIKRHSLLGRKSMTNLAAYLKAETLFG